MKTKDEFLRKFYDEKINTSFYGRQFVDLTIDEKKRMEETFSFQWFVFIKDWNKLKKETNIKSFLMWYISILVIIVSFYLLVIIFNSITI